AKKFAGDKVINDLRVTGAQQVMLQVKVAEMQRNLSKSLDFLPIITAGRSPGSPGFAISRLEPVNTQNFIQAIGRLTLGSFHFQEVLDALEAKGAVKILAEPNLVAMSGDTANFLAGGEFPIPVAQSQLAGIATVTVEFKPFGISLAFTPTVIEGDLINLVVAPAVSQLDQVNAVTFNGFTIPA